MIRLTSIALKDFKNVKGGTIPLSSWKPGNSVLHSDLVGIYGQNGSGKSSIIQAFAILKGAMLGLPIDHLVKDCVSKEAKSAQIIVSGYSLHADSLEPSQFFTYELSFAEGEKPRVLAEKLSLKNLDGGGSRPTLRPVFCYGVNPEYPQGFSITPVGLWDALASMDTALKTDLAIAQRITFETSRSYLFSKEFDEFLRNCIALASDQEAKLSKRAGEAINNLARPLTVLLDVLRLFATEDLAVVSASQQAEAMINHLTISTHQGDLGNCTDASFVVDVSEPALVQEGHMVPLQKTVETISDVLTSMVPNLTIGVRDLGSIMLPEGALGHRIEIVSVRGDVTVPLRCESEGIKKLVGMLTMLIDVYGKPGACVVIDEIDAGIFEFLLGELLQLLSDHGRGQLVFTAHNLRPLETVNNSSLVFTTTNPNNRYIHFKGNHATNNLRSQYLRAINLGGQPETIYEPTSRFKMDGAFYDASHPFDR